MGKLAIRQGDSLTTGHLCATTTTLAPPGQGDVYIEGALVSRRGDPTVSHPFPPVPACLPHVASVGHGSPNVYVHGQKVGYITGPADAGSMISANGTVRVATNAEAVALLLNIEVFEPVIDTTVFPTIEAFATEVIEGRETEEAAGEDPETFEAIEYGDGGISSARYNNTSPVNNVSGAQDTPAVTTGQSDSPDPDASGTPGLNFLPHTDPRIKTQLKNILQSVASTLGVTLDITSAYRSPAYNASVGGAKTSQHMLGNACDIVQTGWSDSQRANFITTCYNAGIRGFGVYNGFTHVDIGNKRAWGNTGSRTSLPRYPWAQSALSPFGYATS